MTPSLTSLQGEVNDWRAPPALLPVRHGPDITAILGVGLHVSYPQRRLSSVNGQQISIQQQQKQQKQQQNQKQQQKQQMRHKTEHSLATDACYKCTVACNIKHFSKVTIH